jgi:5-oxoprolinase (ATP-hydrolysing)
MQPNLAELEAAISANVRGITLVHRLFDEFGIEKVLFNMKQIQMVARETVKSFLRQVYDRFDGKPLRARDFVSCHRLIWLI